MSTLGPIEQKHHALMNELARALNEMFAGYGFALLVFDKDTHDGRMNYICNCDRGDMLIAMKEFIAHNEGRVLSTPGDKQ